MKLPQLRLVLVYVYVWAGRYILIAIAASAIFGYSILYGYLVEIIGLSLWVVIPILVITIPFTFLLLFGLEQVFFKSEEVEEDWKNRVYEAKLQKKEIKERYKQSKILSHQVRMERNVEDKIDKLAEVLEKSPIFTLGGSRFLHGVYTVLILLAFAIGMWTGSEPVS
tara:strand:+ start:383 stop:883 length:501 start_codon:yes stop_codon:yes gene_type:complete